MSQHVGQHGFKRFRPIKAHFQGCQVLGHVKKYGPIGSEYLLDLDGYFRACARLRSAWTTTSSVRVEQVSLVFLSRNVRVEELLLRDSFFAGFLACSSLHLVGVRSGPR